LRERGRGGRLRGFRGFRRCRAGQGPGGDRIFETRITRRSTKGARRGVEPQITQILEISQMRGGLGPGGDRVLEPRIARRGAEGAEGGGTADCGDSGGFADAGRLQRGGSRRWCRWDGVVGGWPRGTGGPKRRRIRGPTALCGFPIRSAGTDFREDRGRERICRPSGSSST
jgi:hypothetical protein